MSEHPTLEALVRYAEGVGDPDERSDTERHLGSCARCRTEIEAIRQLGPALAGLPDRKAPGGLWRRIEEGLRGPAGEPAVSVAPSGRRAPRWPRIGWLGFAAGLATVAALSLALVLRPGTAAAGTSVLEISRVETAPDGAGQLSLVYRTSGRLAARPRLRVRGQVWRWAGSAPEFSQPEFVEGTLVRSEPGAFEGTLELPGETAFAWFAVEDSAGTILELGGWPRWELLAGGDAPTRAALLQRMKAYSLVDPARARDLARAFTTRYPHDPLGWNLRTAFELRLVPMAARASLLEELRATARELDARFGSEDLEAETASAMWWLAARLELEELQRQWGERLRRFPRHPTAVEHRLSELYRRLADQPRPRLESLETEWARWHESEVTPLLGFRTAVETGEPDAVRRWGLRVVESSPHSISNVAERFADLPGLHGEAARLARAGLTHLAAEGLPRPLERTRRKHGAELEMARARLLSALGAALAGAGHGAAALDTLALATSSVWAPDVFRSAASTLLAIGDTARAAVELARLTVDPASRAEKRGVTSPPPGITAERWQDLLARARDELDRRIRRTLDDVALSASVETLDGGRRELSELAEGSPVVVLAFFYSLEPDASMYLGRSADQRRALEEAAIPLLAVVGSAPVSDAVALSRAEEEHGLSFFRDLRGDVMSVVQRWPTATYFVLERGSRIRYGGDIGGALRTAVVLSRER